MTDRVETVEKVLQEWRMPGGLTSPGLAETIIWALDREEQAGKDELRKRPFECGTCGGVLDRTRNDSPFFHVTEPARTHVVLPRDRKPA